MIPSFVTTLVVTALPVCGPLDLKTALSLSLDRSDDVAISQSELATARTDEALAKALRVIPSGSATFIVGPAPGARGTVTQATGSTNRSLTSVGAFGRLDLTVVQPLYTWGRLDAAEEAARAGLRARGDLLSGTEAQVQLRVAELYWGIALANRLVDLAKEVDKALGQASDELERMEREGSTDVGPADRFRLDLFRSAVKVRQADAERALDLARIGLAATLATSADNLKVRSETLEFTVGELPSREALVMSAEEQRPDLRALSEAIRAREAEVKAERAAMLPQVFALGVFAYSYAPNRTVQLNPWVSDFFNTLNFGAVVGLKQDLAIPTLSAKAEKAQTERETLVRQRAGLMRLIEAEVNGTFVDLKAADTKYVASKQGLTSGRSLFRSVSLDFEAGVIEAKTLIESYGAYVESQVTAAQAAYDLAVARAHLAQVTGEAPTKGSPPCELR